VFSSDLHDDVSRKSRKNEIAKMEAEIRKLTKRHDEESDEDVKRKKPKKSYLEAELAKYTKGRGKHKKGKDGKRRVDESDMLTALNSFRGKLQNQKWSDGEDDDVTMSDETKDLSVEDGTNGGAKAAAGGEEDPGLEVDDDFGFMNHVLHFPKDNGEETQKAERDYEVIDPRQRGAQAREEDKERRRALKASRQRR
jgi:peptidyl-prolyl cis-trans isomerase SDCCAG10